MAKIRSWKQSLDYYEKLVGIECNCREDVNRLIEALCDRDLRTCPHDIICNTVVVPKIAVKFLPLKEIKHKKVELRQRISLGTEVNRELGSRFNGDSAGSHYYTCGQGSNRTCVKYLVTLATVKDIEKFLRSKRSKK